MLRLFGIRTNPTIRITFGAVLLAIGIFLQATIVIVVGALLAIWGVATLIYSQRPAPRRPAR